MVIDTLHLFLRVADILINLLIQDLRREDGIAKATNVDLSKHTGITAYEKFLNEACKVTFRWYTCKETRQLKWRDLTGPEKVRVFNNIDIPKYLPMLKNAAALQDIWREFWRLFTMLESCHSDDTNELREEIRNWCQTKHITPYIHAFACHVPEFINKFGSVCKFNHWKN